MPAYSLAALHSSLTVFPSFGQRRLRNAERYGRRPELFDFERGAGQNGPTVVPSDFTTDYFVNLQFNVCKTDICERHSVVTNRTQGRYSHSSCGG